MAGKLQKISYEKGAVCSSEKPVLERPRLSWKVNINFILGVRECDSMGMIALTLDKRPVKDCCESGNEQSPSTPPKKRNLSTTWANIVYQERLGFMELVSVICVGFLF
jgi:hypothetical protein